MTRRLRTGSGAGKWIAITLVTGGALGALGSAGGVAAYGQSCPSTVQTEEELRILPALAAKPVPSLGPVLDTTFAVQMKTLCVPVQTGSTWSSKALSLRTYVYPDPKTGQQTWGYTDPKTGQKWTSPGPTLLLNKPRTPQGQGDRLWIKLVNELSPPTTNPNQCDSACPATTTCPSSTSALPPSNNCGNLCCCWVDLQQKFPGCFHGDNVTNLHFHGAHVSPQAPQDYALLELYPRLLKGKRPPGVHAAHRGGKVALSENQYFGEYQYKVDPLLMTQPEGTFWYHPHNHGSVALQVANGMAGTLQIEGELDDWLRTLYGGKGKLAEKLLVIQQIQQTTSLFNLTGGVAPPLLVNGQAIPKITMAPGEVQRWRLVNATMENGTQITITFPAQLEVRQIAMDGIQFAPENYGSQPLLVNNVFQTLSPGNRADFLVRATPTCLQTAKPQPMRFPVTARVVGTLSPRSRQRLQLRDLGPKAALGAAAAATPLFIPMIDCGLPHLSMKLPDQAQWPKMPEYLHDIPPPAVQGGPTLTFSMNQGIGGPVSGTGDPATMFFINNKQYDPECVNVTTLLDTAQEWTLQNSSALQHPFHIHTNPFQVISDSSLTTQPKSPYVWYDTYALPAAPTSGTSTSYTVVMRQKYTDFTGAYVLHCHFLGHEDRGMMFGVQTVCPNNPKDFGKAKPGGQQECVTGNFTTAFPGCLLTAPAKAASQ
jgi:FtsP/CotA-like multicopper oxidase with cupredoxin domain